MTRTIGDTTEETYTRRLLKREYKRWKTTLDVQRPYRWNLKRIQPGITLDIGCGIGRLLKYLPAGSIGIDHNKYSIDNVRSIGLLGFTPTEFRRSKYSILNSFDSILLGHVLEHLSPSDGIKLLKTYLPYLKSDGKVIIFCPQEKGFKSDPTHITFHNIKSLDELLVKAGLKSIYNSSFPLPKVFGKYFTYNEFVVIGKKL